MGLLERALRSRRRFALQAPGVGTAERAPQNERVLAPNRPRPRGSGRLRVTSSSAARRITGPRGVAQSGSAPGWGPGGRRFKSCLPDQTEAPLMAGFLFAGEARASSAMYRLCTVFVLLCLPNAVKALACFALATARTRSRERSGPAASTGPAGVPRQPTAIAVGRLPARSGHVGGATGRQRERQSG